MNKKYLISLTIFVGCLIFNIFLGSFLYSKISNKELLFEKGKACSESVSLCEKTYFSKYTEDINRLQNESDDYFAKILIDEHIDEIGYVANCPCPYNVDSVGNYCGERSSYSKNGKVQYCYLNDFPIDEILYKQESIIEKTSGKLSQEVRDSITFYKSTTISQILIFLIIINIILIIRNILRSKNK